MFAARAACACMPGRGSSRHVSCGFRFSGSGARLVRYESNHASEM
jgi:hypothetical protein